VRPRHVLILVVGVVYMIGIAYVFTTDVDVRWLCSHGFIECKGP
jgi:hypothetical protein